MKILLLAGKGASTTMLYHAIAKDYPLDNIILENPEKPLLFLKRRLRRLGFVTVLGQLMFQFGIQPLLLATSKKRIKAIKNKFGLIDTDIPSGKITEVDSINSSITVQKIKAENPDVILVNGTRIISKKILNATNCPYINIHAGITPQYRGVHGLYWALYQNDPKNGGVTVHLVDAGIDTGNIIKQEIVQPEKADNFATYPLLQLAVGIKLLKKALEDLQNNTLQLQETTSTESRLWYHPTIWQYLKKRIFSGVK